VWGNRGATIVRVEEAPTLVHVNMRHGTVMSLRNTASGRLFAAFLPRETVLAALASEAAHEPRRNAPPALDAAFERELDEVRALGLCRVDETAVPGVSAISAPVFDDSGAIVLAVTAIGPTPVFDTRPDGATATALRRCALELSQRLGARAAA
jgi:DNA-binding IclR family transcriptional regulator